MTNLELLRAPDIEQKIYHIVTKLKLTYITPTQVSAFRSTGSKARARARIYAMPRIWQEALNLRPHYCLEFISEHFDHLSDSDQTRIIIHELMHIPKSFSGALVPHRGASRRHQVTNQTVEKLYQNYLKTCS
jgi:predicted metallopeptidase